MPPNVFLVSRPDGFIKIFVRMLDALDYAVHCNGILYQYSLQPSVNIRLRTKEPKKGNIKK